MNSNNKWLKAQRPVSKLNRLLNLDPSKVTGANSHNHFWGGNAIMRCPCPSVFMWCSGLVKVCPCGNIASYHILKGIWQIACVRIWSLAILSCGVCSCPFTCAQIYPHQWFLQLTLGAVFQLGPVRIGNSTVRGSHWTRWPMQISHKSSWWHYK